MLKDDPSSNCFVLLAEILIKRKKIEDALKVLVNGLRHNKHNITARFLLGKIYFERWMIDNAKREFEKVIKLAPDNIAVSKILIQIYTSEENIDAALKVAKKLLFYHQENEEIKLIINQLSTGNYIKEPDKPSIDNDSVINPLSAYLTETSGNEVDLATETLANLYFEQGHHARAIEILNKLLEQNPGNNELLEKIEKIKKAELNLYTA
ncbi:MAG: tetratricopeptide repeat protein [Thermodesulfobacteriota bacterium]